MASERKIQDAQLVTTVTMPVNATGANTANGSLIDLGGYAGATLDAAAERIQVLVSIPASSATVQNNTQNAVLCDAPDNNGANMTPIPGLDVLTITGNAGANGSVAVERYYSLPRTTRRFLGLRSQGAANSGNNVPTLATAKVLA